MIIFSVIKRVIIGEYSSVLLGEKISMLISQYNLVAEFVADESSPGIEPLQKKVHKFLRYFFAQTTSHAKI